MGPLAHFSFQCDPVGTVFRENCEVDVDGGDQLVILNDQNPLEITGDSEPPDDP